ncbi:MAG: Ig-like domain-containing protein, partial [bacterium]
MKKLTTVLSLFFIVALSACTVGANYSGPVLTLTSIAVKPANPSIAESSTQQFTATGTYSDATTKDITSSVTWTASDPSVTFSSTTSGLAIATVDGGPFTISADLGSVSGSTTLTV